MHPSKFREMGTGPGDAAPPLPSSLNPIQSAIKNPNWLLGKNPVPSWRPAVEDEQAGAEEWQAGGLGS